MSGSQHPIKAASPHKKAFTSKGGYCCEEKSHKHWSLCTMLSSSVTANFFSVKKIKERLYALNVLKIIEKKNILRKKRLKNS